MPRIGQLDRRLTFQTKTDVRSASGDNKPTYVDSFTVSAMRVDMKGREKYEQGTLIEHADIKYFIRYRSDAENLTLRLKDEDSGNFYDIYSINRMGRDKYLEIMCKLMEDKVS